MTTFIKTPFAVDGEIEAIPDATQADGKVSMRTGYTFDYERDLETDPSAKDIGRPEMNWLFNLVTDAIRQYQTEGTFPFITAAINGGTAFPYKKFARCTYAVGGVSGIFESLVDNNTSDPSDTTKWKKLVTPGEISVNTTAPLTGGGTLSGNLTLGLASPLPVANGGTGLTAAPSLLTNLATTTAASPFVALPRPGVTGTLPIANGGTGNTAGLAATATALATARTIQTNLASTATASFNGSANVTPGVTGTLPIGNGGTGNTAGLAATATALATARTIQTNLASTATASFNGTANVTPGVTGTLPIGNGGTGNTAGLAATATALATARTIQTNLASTATASFNGTANVTPGVTGTLPVANGGTAANTAAGALTNLGAAPANATLTDAAESATLPATTSATLAAQLQTVRNCLKWITARMDFRTSSVTIYVRTDGNDSNNGFTNSATGAVASWTGVFEAVRKINIRHASVTVAFQAGTFAGVTVVGPQITGSGSISFVITGVAGSTFFSSVVSFYGGIRATVTNCHFQAGASVRENASVSFTTCKFTGQLTVQDNGTAILTSPHFIGATTAVAGVVAAYRGYIRIGTGVTFEGAFTVGIDAYAGGHADISPTNGMPMTFTNASFSTAFVRVGAHGGGTFTIRGTPVITGSATGVRWLIQNGGKIVGRTATQLNDMAWGSSYGGFSGSGVTGSGQFITTGTTAASGYLLADGTDLVSLFGGGALKPASGSWVPLWGSPATLPSGGTWAYFHWAVGKEHYMGAGIRAGGSTVGGSGETYIGFAWRIA